jgi:hypothetical protein
MIPSRSRSVNSLLVFVRSSKSSAFISSRMRSLVIGSSFFPLYRIALGPRLYRMGGGPSPYAFGQREKKIIRTFWGCQMLGTTLPVLSSWVFLSIWFTEVYALTRLEGRSPESEGTSPGIKGVKPRARINQIGRVPIDWEGSCSTPLSRCFE